MSRFRLRALVLSLISAVLLISSVGHGQAARGRAVVRTVGLPPVDRGLAAHEPIDPRTPAHRAPVVDGPSRDRIGARGARYVPGRVIVKFRGGISGASRVSALAAASPTAAMAARPAGANFDIVTIDAAEDPEAAARALSARSDVEYAQADYRVYPYFVPNDSLYRVQWNFPQIDLERGWDLQRGGSSSIVVAVLDSGIAYRDVTERFFNVQGFTSGGFTYPPLGTIDVDFARASDLATSADRFVLPRDFIWGDNDPVDLDGHGTHVAGTIGELTNNNFGLAGVAFNVRLMPLKVISGDWDDVFGSPNVGTDEIVALGIRYAADNGAKVLNMSIGRTGGGPAPAVEDAVRYAVGKGCFVAIAGGNEAEAGNPLEVLAEIASRVNGAVAVAATDRSVRRAYYSSSGSYLELAAPGGSFRVGGDDGFVFQQTYDLDFTFTGALVFPGVPPSQYRAPRFDVLAAVGFQGTSMATPHVSGLAALLMSQGVTNPAAIEAAMERFATDLGAPGRDSEYGFGQISARNTLIGLGLAR